VRPDSCYWFRLVLAVVISPKKIRTGSGSDRLLFNLAYGSEVARLLSTRTKADLNAISRSLPPPQPGCPAGDPGLLPVLISLVLLPPAIIY
jgi:hypothetical protein